ncbi:MAG: hypothetical protein MPN21_27365 [Thermoanaerobaculia bacterium]|nr:hypothetical protein [Thermoanaerobaculia bacterium]
MIRAPQCRDLPSHRPSLRRLVAVCCLVVAATWVAKTGADEPTASTRSGEDVRIENLRAFAKLLGYVRYFHPSDEAHEVDWNAFAIAGARQVRDVETREELQRVLADLFLPIAPTAQLYFQSDSPPALLEVLNTSADLPLVAWQHQGVDLGRPGVYRSVRLHRKSEQPTSGFGPFSQGLDAATHRGHEIRLTGSLRAEVEGA